MEAFWADAENIFETARQATVSHSPDCDWAILIGAQGGIRMMEAAGWALPGLLAEYGANRAYRVTRQSGSVRLEGRSGAERCLLHCESPARIASQMLAARPDAAWHHALPRLLTGGPLPQEAPQRPKEQTCTMFV